MLMTDDERIAHIERMCRQMQKSVIVGLPLGLINLPVPDIELLLRIIRDQRAELRQLESYHVGFEGNTQMENKTMTPSEIELAGSLIQRYRHLREAMVELPKKEDVAALMLKLTYAAREPIKHSMMSDRQIVLAYCGNDVPDMVAKLGVLADEAASRLAELGVDVRDIV
jgi:hypothetical protein